MYNIEKTNFGYQITFGDFIMPEEMTKWFEESKEKLATSYNDFGLLVDMRALKPLPKEAQEIMQAGQKYYKMNGMKRSCVILNNPTTMMQFKRIAKNTGINTFERYIDSSANPNWMETAVNWLTNQVDPDKE